MPATAATTSHLRMTLPLFRPDPNSNPMQLGPLQSKSQELPLRDDMAWQTGSTGIILAPFAAPLPGEGQTTNREG